MVNLNRLITIERESTTTNRVGTPQETYVFLKEAWANVFVASGNTQYGSEGQLPFSQNIFTVRYDDKIDYKCRIIYNNNYYKIEHIEEVERKHWLQIRTVVWERATIR